MRVKGAATSAHAFNTLRDIALGQFWMEINRARSST